MLKQLLLDAKAEALADTTSDENFEFYIERYLSGEEALAMKRNRRVMGFCSMDTRPRSHALDICRLAAETAKWEIFLRSHLDIMNDRFDRASDGSWAWKDRQTYLKELEELDIAADDLLIGTCLRVDNAADNHYWGAIDRIGRALADVSNKTALEKRLLNMISNEDMDPYNRLLLAYLYSNYTYNLADEDRKKANIKTLKTVKQMLPIEVKKYMRG